MEGGVVSAVTGAMRTLLPKLGALLASKYKLSSGVHKQIVSLRNEMSTMNALLVRLSRMAVLDEQQRDWRDKVRELSYDMEDCVDVFTHDLNGGGKAWLRRRLRKIKTRHKIASRIEELKARALEVSSCHDRYKIDERTLSPSPDCIPSPGGLVAIDPRMEALYVDAHSLVGIDGPREKVIKLLSREEEGANRLIRVAAVVGSGGMGKTTLAHQVYTKIKSQFDCKAFVTVSQNASTFKTLSDIYQAFRGGWMPSSLKDGQLIVELRKYLRDKRYLIVLDDIWVISAWNSFKVCFLENNLGSRVITTTRNEDIAKACCSSFHGHVYRIKPLNDLDSRRLLYKRIFYSDGACPEQLKYVSGEILKKCDGVPLAILSVASYLASHEEVNSKETWEKMQNHLGFPLEGHPALEWMRHVLTLGYNDLSLELKTCLLYLGIFPQGSKTRKENLVKRWISEGFVTEKHGYGPEEIAESYFSELINKNMIQIAEYDDCGHVLSCKVHDLMLDFIIIKSTEENFITVIKEPPTANGAHNRNGRFEFRRLSLQLSNSCTEVLGNTALTQARSLNFWGEPECMPSLSSFQLLRVLHLYACGDEYQDYDLSPVCNFFQLSYLKIGGVHCEKQLRELHKLQNLKTLELACGVGSFRLDVSILPLTLCHLIVPTGVELFGGIGRMKALCTLVGFSMLHRDLKSMKALSGLSNLRELELYLEGPFVPDSDTNYDSAYDSLLLSLSRLGRLQSITFHGLARYSYLEKYVLTCWSTPPPSHLHRLHAQGFTFSIVPDWVAQLNQLRSLKIEVRSLLKDGVEVLARLTMLVHLDLYVREHVPLQGLVIQAATFPNLKEFWLRYKAPCLMFEAGAMPRVHSLTMECYAEGERQGDDSVLDGIEHLRSLETFKVYICHQENFSRVVELSSRVSEQPPRVEEIQRRNERSLEAILRKAINKHPGSPDVSIEPV